MKGKLLKKGDIHGDRYRIDGWLGEGGMQQVFRAHDELLGRDVALKVPKDSSTERRFHQSAVVSARVNQNNVAKTLDYFEQGGRQFLIEEFVDGENLGEILREHVPYLPPQAAARVLHQLAKGVEASHAAGVVHRDLKPSNIMVVGGASLSLVKITDFGIARMAEREIGVWAQGDQSGTSSKTVIGAIPYMAPEAITTFKKAGMPADIWAIAAIVYELMAGTKPYGQGLAAVPAILEAKPPSSPAYIASQQFNTLGAELMAVIRLCLRKEVDKRPSAAALIKMCEELCYTADGYQTGTVTYIKHKNYGFFRADSGSSGFYHKDSFYGDNVISVGTRIWFALHPGGGNPRAFPIVKLHQKF